jgi:hypothetical protein
MVLIINILVIQICFLHLSSSNLLIRFVNMPLVKYDLATASDLVAQVVAN